MHVQALHNGRDFHRRLETKVFETELLCNDDFSEQFPEDQDVDHIDRGTALDARRRIEKLRELRCLRELLDDLDLDDFE